MDAAVGPAERTRAVAAAERALAALEHAGRALEARASLIFGDDDGYPPPLRDLPDPPVALFAIGSRQASSPSVAIVGTRAASPYGERVTRELAGSLARAGACVVSGLARGIDAAAHRAALEAKGTTVAVLGTGVDVAYPAAHRPLHRQVAREGLVLSEMVPGATPTRGSFPRRNRIIAALADVTIVVEAGHRSGALITAGHALELGRVVAAVPGPIDAPQSAGTNELLRDGAMVIASVADGLALLGLTAPVAGARTIGNADEQAVWDALGRGPLDLDTIATRAALPARRCMTAVTSLEIAGAIECALTGEIRRR